MNIKTCSILLSCLLVGNFFVELNAHILRRNAPIRRRDVSIRRRSANNKIQPNSKENLDLKLTNVEKNLVIENTTSNAGFILDLEQNVLLLLDGSCGSGVIVILNENKTALISSGLWEDSKECLLDFLKSLNNDITEVLRHSDCDKYDLSSSPKNLLEEVSKIVQELVILIDLELQQRPVLALQLIVSISISIVDLVNGNLSGLELAIRNQVITLSVDISGLLNVLRGLDDINSPLNATITELYNLNPDLNIAPILEAADGVQALIEIFKQLNATGLDLLPLTKELCVPNNFFTIFVELGGSVSFGISGAFKVVIEILATIEGKSNLESLISLLIEYVAQSNQQVHKNLVPQLNEGLSQLFNLLLQLLGPSNGFDLTQLVKDLLDQKLTFDDVNIFGIISILLDGASESKERLLSVIVEVLLRLDPGIPSSESLPKLILVIISQLDSVLGIQNLIALGINLSQPLQDCLLSASN